MTACNLRKYLTHMDMKTKFKCEYLNLNPKCPRSTNQLIGIFVGNLRYLRFDPKKQRVGEWCPPPPDLLKFMLMVLQKENGNGGVNYNCKGLVIECFPNLWGSVGLSIKAGVLAIFNALKFCEEFGFKHFLTKSDSTIAF